MATKHLSKYKPLGLVILSLIFINYLSQIYTFRLDFTKDKRYTLSEYSKTIAKELNTDIDVDLYLSGPSLPPEFKYLQQETLELIKSFQALTSHNININFIDPIELKGFQKKKTDQFLNRLGVTPLTVTQNEDGKTIRQEVYPYAIVSSQKGHTTIPLVENKLGMNSRSLASKAVQKLEYAFAKGLILLTQPKTKKIGLLKGNGQMADIKVADLLKTLYQRYYIGLFSLDSISKGFKKSLGEISQYDLIISAKPSLKFEEKEKYLLDQYLMDGGAMLWLVDAVSADTDSLYVKNKITVYPFDLNLVDYFFSYGIRFKYNLILDAYSAPIMVASGEGSQSQYTKLPWAYAPLINVDQINHPITKNVAPIKLDFAGSIDTLENKISKTVLMKTSDLTKVSGGLRFLSIDEVSKPFNFSEFNSGNFITGILLEGRFNSMYKNRVKPYDLDTNKEHSSPTKMIIISDGDIIKNQTHRGQPLETGYDKWTHNYFGNKDFLINTVDYLLDEHELISLRGKNIKTAQLDFVKTYSEGTKWKVINIILPILCFALLTSLLNYFRQKHAKTL